MATLDGTMSRMRDSKTKPGRVTSKRSTNTKAKRVNGEHGRRKRRSKR